jgi:anti-sigma factor RsiW
MTRCLDEGKLQSYFDGELSIEMMESLTSHLASCVTCAAAARELAEESALLTSALAVEFETSVPTERLRQRIDAAVFGDRLATAQSTSRTSGLSAFFTGLLNFGTQRTLGYASLVVILALAAIIGIVKMKSANENAVQTPQQANNQSGNQIGNQAGNNQQVAKAQPDDSSSIPPVEISAPQKARVIPDHRPIRAVPASTAPTPAPVKLLPGERTYLQTIAKLDSTIKSGKKSMRPGLQVEYERNLAVVDRAIAATRSAAKSNPNDPDAADFMFAAYQSKVDLLNTIADARVGSGGRGH